MRDARASDVDRKDNSQSTPLRLAQSYSQKVRTLPPPSLISFLSYPPPSDLFFFFFFFSLFLHCHIAVRLVLHPASSHCGARRKWRRTCGLCKGQVSALLSDAHQLPPQYRALHTSVPDTAHLSTRHCTAHRALSQCRAWHTTSKDASSWSTACSENVFSRVEFCYASLSADPDTRSGTEGCGVVAGGSGQWTKYDDEQGDIMADFGITPPNRMQETTQSLSKVHQGCVR